MRFLKRLFVSLALLGGFALTAAAADSISSMTVTNAGGTFGGHYDLIYANSSDGTGELNVTKFDAPNLSGAPTRLKITEIQWSCSGMNVGIAFDGTSKSTATILSGQGWLKDLSAIDPWVSGHTGKIMFTTIGASAGDGYVIRIKAVPAS